MTISRVQRAASTSANPFGTGAYSSASFTPAANSLLVVVVMAIESANNGLRGTTITCSDTGNGLTWTARAQTTASPAWSYGVAIFTAPVGSSPNAMTVQVDAGAASVEYYRLEVFEYTSDIGECIAAATAIGSDADGDGAASITLSAAPATASEVIAGCFTGLASGTGTITPGSGYTEINDSTVGGWGVQQTQSRTGSTSTTVDWVDVCATGTPFGGSALAALEIAEQSSATVDQDKCLIGADDGNEAAHTLGTASETKALGVSAIVRAIVEATSGDPASVAYTWRVSKNGGAYVPLPVGATTSPTIGNPTVGALAYSALNGTSVAPSYPASIAAGDALILLIGQKPATANGGTVTTPSGWTLLDSELAAGGYGATLGADTGNTNLLAYSKDTVDGTESGTLTVTVGDNNVCWAAIIRVPKTDAGTWSIIADSGSDTSAGNVSIATAGGMAVAAGDMLLGAMCIPTDVTTPAQFSAQAFAQTGTTFGTAAELAEPDSGTGNDIGGFIFYQPASSGSGSGAVTMTATAGGTTTNVRGPGLVIRLRVAGVANEVYVAPSSNIAGGGVATTARMTPPTGMTTSNFVAGQLVDDANSFTLNLPTASYSEGGVCVATQAPAANGDTFDFRLYAGSTALATYTQTGRLTVGSGAAPKAPPPVRRRRVKLATLLHF